MDDVGHDGQIAVGSELVGKQLRVLELVAKDISQEENADAVVVLVTRASNIGLDFSSGQYAYPAF